SLASQPLDIVRAGLETVAYRFAMIHERLRDACPRLREVVGTGAAVLASPAWSRTTAEALREALTLSAEAEASSPGAAVLALEALGLFPSMEAARAGTRPLIPTDANRHARYRAGLDRHRQLYDLLVSLPTAARRSSP